MVAVPSNRPRGGETAAFLAVIRGQQQGVQFELDAEPLDIGREGCTVTIPHDLVSRRHAVVQRAGPVYLIRDLDSTNGTFVNDERVTERGLKDGDQISIGKTVLKFMTADNPELEYLRQMFEKTHRDALTGAYNKRHFDGELERLVSISRQEGEPLSLIVFDIDHFKKINDTHGHPAGDHVLQQIVEVVSSQVRERDVFARVGGEEFAIVLPRTIRPVAMSAAEIIRGVIEMTEIAYDGKRIAVTLSLGVAELEEADNDDAALYKRADERLYEAKRGGRNQVC
jgi:diguanylate cyclase (GGDEF)-like protein